MKDNLSTVENFGCRLNIYESEVIKSIIKSGEVEGVVFVNTCAVTKEAERQARQKIRRIKKQKPLSSIVVTGCASQINSKSFVEMEEVSLVLGNDVKTNKDILLNIKNYIDQANNGVIEKDHLVGNIMKKKKEEIQDSVAFEGRTRAFVQVQNGCNHRCTFCIIPYGRGNSRSLSERDVLKQIENLLEGGYKEVVLTGVDITSYGGDFEQKNSLGLLCKKIFSFFPDLPRLRLSSIDVAEIDDDLFDIIFNEKRFMPHLHISLQSGDDVILKRMKRRHTRKDVLDFCQKVRSVRKDVCFGSDIICGFPTETEDMFLNTCNLLKEAGVIFNHVFTYSQRNGTIAAIMEQVATDVKKDRTRRLIEQTKKQINDFLSTIKGSSQRVIIESDGCGRAENFCSVKIENIEDFKQKTDGKIEVVLFDNSFVKKVSTTKQPLNK